MKILNLYAGIGGNRKLWGNEHEITAVELNPKIAEIYKDFFPNDNVIVDDAHQYLLDHYKEFDFIWASPPCPTHSPLRKMGILGGTNKPVYPDITLWQEIIFIQNFYKLHTFYVIENVKTYYKPLVVPNVELQGHYFWSNFYIPNVNFNKPRNIKTGFNDSTDNRAKELGFEIKDVSKKLREKVINNCVEPEIGKYILDCALEYQEPIQEGLFAENG